MKLITVKDQSFKRTYYHCTGWLGISSGVVSVVRLMVELPLDETITTGVADQILRELYWPAR